VGDYGGLLAVGQATASFVLLLALFQFDLLKLTVVVISDDSAPVSLTQWNLECHTPRSGLELENRSCCQLCWLDLLYA
jgi:hypothetical protein